MKTLLLTGISVVALLAAAIALMGVKALFVKGGEFPSGHVHDLPRRRRHALARLKNKQNSKINIKSNR
ncbi:MAG: hypothetical protein K2L97_06840 [Muribaculaceae bacterium]|nr:hypothetical protein [Muribaculaceae bacterium]